MTVQKKILFIDDEVDILEAVKIILEDAGFKVKTAEDINSPKEVIAYMPDLIIADALLVKKTVEDISKLLKSNPVTGKIPIVILSAQSLSRLAEIAKKCGASGFLQKPFEMSELITLIKNTA